VTRDGRLGDEATSAPPAGLGRPDTASTETVLACCSDSSPRTLRRVARSIGRRNPDAIVFAGDVRPDGFGVGHLRGHAWQRAWGGLARRVVTVPGNHDYAPSQLEPWRFVGGELADTALTPGVDGSFVLDLPHLCVLGFSTGRRADAVSDAQVEWAAGRLDADRSARCRIAVFHAPAFPVSQHIGSSLDVDPAARDRLCDALAALEVDVVVNGHEHLYARRPIGRRPIVQIICGGAGADISATLSADVAASYEGHHAVVLRAAADGLFGEAFTPDGEVIDRFSVVRDP
jgi:hypothetical protein